jgi:hypothetical protein
LIKDVFRDISKQINQYSAIGAVISQYALFGKSEKMINDDVFAGMVAEEVKNKLSVNQKKELLKEENWERWRDALLALIDNIEDQVAGIDEDAELDRLRYETLGKDGRRLAKEASLAYASRKAKVTRFLFHVNKRLDEVVQMIETGEKIQSDGWAEIDFLRKGIIRHRMMIREFDLEETAIDKALWSTLDGKWNFDSIDPSSL